ncbi:MAG: SRPBCC domain-containing protein, partial [Helicobacteraceae bacterium]|nr:SRPBCC domain-containing protein [Helicobacteraceae bacterium]
MAIKEIYTEALIISNSTRIWKILTDFDNFPNWNPFIKYIKGNVAIGNTIKVRIEPPDSMPITFAPKVLEIQENRKLCWRGKFLFSGLFDGEHCFELNEQSNGTTIFIQKEKFSGIFVG